LCNDAIKANFWPGSSDRPCYVFDQQLFLFYDLLQKNNPGISEYGFIKTIEQVSEQKGRVCDATWILYIIECSNLSFYLSYYVYPSYMVQVLCTAY